MQLKTLLPYLLFFLVLLGIAFFLTFNYLDPDFGWHLRTGQLILQQGPPHVDWYSFTMPQYPWVDHEWLMDVGIWQVYNSAGIRGLQFLFLVIYTLSFFIIRDRRWPWWAFVPPVFLGYLATIEFLGIRPQLFTVFFIALLLKIVDLFLEKNSKLIYFLPLLFLAWANLHASFFAGLFILCIVITCQLIKKAPPKKIGLLLAITAASFLATLVNPYGVRIYNEVFSVVGDNYLKFHIAEWMPLPLTGFKPLIILYLAMVVGLGAVLYRKINFTWLVLSAVFLLLSISSIRYFLLFVMVSLPMVCQGLWQLGQVMDPRKIAAEFKQGSLFAKAMYVMPALVFAVLFGIYCWQVAEPRLSAPSPNFYPEKAISFLKTLPASDHILNDYSWGGYLIWKMPERKWFIDGRMPSWRLPAQAGQDGRFVFKDYMDIMAAEPGFEQLLQKYDVNMVLIPASSQFAVSASANNAKESKLMQLARQYPWLGFVADVSVHRSLYQELKKLGWSVMYQDETALVLKKP